MFTGSLWYQFGSFKWGVVIIILTLLLVLFGYFAVEIFEISILSRALVGIPALIILTSWCFAADHREKSQ